MWRQSRGLWRGTAVLQASLEFRAVCEQGTREHRVACREALFSSPSVGQKAVGIQGRLGASAAGPSAFPRAVRLRGSSLLAGQRGHSESFPRIRRAPRPPALLRALEVLPLFLPVGQLVLVPGEMAEFGRLWHMSRKRKREAGGRTSEVYYVFGRGNRAGVFASQGS